MKNEFEATLTLNHPLTEEEIDTLTDVDFDHTDRVWFYTKHGKEVEFVKVTRCKDCIFGERDESQYMCNHDGRGFVWRDADDYCSYGERRGE